MPQLTRDVLAEEARFILKSLKDGAPAARRMSELSTTLGKSVSIDLGDYLLFLRKHQYITLDTATSTLGVTLDGEKAAAGRDEEAFQSRLGEFFAHRLEEPGFARRRAERDGAEHAKDGNGREDTDVHRVPAPPRATPPPAPRRPEREGAEPPKDESLASGGYVRYDAVGSGGIATVYKGKHATLGTEVAVKELKDLFTYFSFLQRSEVVKRLEKELAAQAALEHPCVVRIADMNCRVARPYWVLEYLPGGSLRARLDEAKGPLPLEQAVRAFFQICHAVRAAHAAGLIHHGLKPENVLFDARGNARVGDFGLGRVLESEATQKLQLAVGGSIGYQPPEQLARKGEARPESDLYSLGILLYEMVVGTLPGRRSPLPSQAQAGVPASLDPIFDRLTQDKPEERYASVAELLKDLAAAFADGGHGDLATIVLASGAAPAGKPAPAPDAGKGKRK